MMKRLFTRQLSLYGFRKSCTRIELFAGAVIGTAPQHLSAELLETFQKHCLEISHSAEKVTLNPSFIHWLGYLSKCFTKLGQNMGPYFYTLPSLLNGPHTLSRLLLSHEPKPYFNALLTMKAMNC